MGPCVKARHRKTIDRLMWRVVLCAVRGSRLVPRDRVGACKRACVWLVVPRVERTRPIFVVPMRSWTFVASSAWQKKTSRVRARRAFKKVVFLSIDYPHICSPRPFPPPLICDCRRSWFVFVVWVAVEQSLTDGWGYTVRSRTMTRIGITSSIHATTPRQENDIQGVTQEQCNYETVHGTTLQVLAVGPAKGKRRKVKEVHLFYPDSALGALSRLCCRLPLFEVLRSRSLMIWPNGVPASLSPLKNPSSLLLKVSYALLVA